MRVAIIVLISAAAAWSQCSAPYGYQRPITVNSGQVTGTLPNFTRTVSGADFGTSLKTVANGGRLQSANGYDVIFVDSGGTNLSFELVGHGGASTTYSATTGAAEFHVLVPSEAVGTAIYACYGAASITTYQGNDASAWNSNYTLAQHLPNGVTLSTTDSKQGFTFTPTNTPTATTGQVDGAINFAAASSQQIQTSHNLNSAAMSMTAWIKPASFPASYNGAISAQDVAASPTFFQIYTRSSGKLAMYAGATGTVSYDGTGTTLSAGTWYHVAMTYSSSAGLVGYINGTVDGTGSANGALSATGTLLIVGSASATFFDGAIDEVHVSNVALSAAWVAAEYHNGISTTGYYTVGAESPAGASFTISPSLIPSGTSGIVLTLSGATTAWVNGTTIFSISGCSGASKTAQNVTSSTAATVTVTTGPSLCTLTLTESVTGSASATTSVYAGFTTRVIGSSNTQFALEYSQGGSCTIEVSESSTCATVGGSCSPLIHDVDPTLFSGANTDTSRTDAVSVGSLKRVPIGKRTTELALDSIYYSRAAQAFTPYYFRITCGSNVSTGYAHTTNIALGSTRGEVPRADPAIAGATLLPTTPDTRNYKVVDPQTGALLQRISVSGDKFGSSFGIFDGFGGITRPCANTPQPDGTGNFGYFCTFWQQDDQRGSLYYIIPKRADGTGAEARNLGSVAPGGEIVASPYIDGNGHMYSYCSGCTPQGEYKYTYNGDFQNHSSASFTAGTLYDAAGVATYLQIYNPAFIPANYNCFFAHAEALEYSSFFCPATGGPSQDVYGWVGIWYGGDGRAADPTCTAGAACPRVVGAINIQDYHCILHNSSFVSGGGGVVALNLKDDGSGMCMIGGVAWYNFLANPNGPPVPDAYWPYGGHDTYDGPLGRATEAGGWGFVLGHPLVNYENIPLTTITDSPLFAGAVGRANGTTTSKHPSYQQDPAQTAAPIEQQWFNDSSMFDGGNLIADEFAGQLVAGTTQIWQYTSQFGGVDRKLIETMAVSGHHTLRDISSPTSAITDADSYTYCVVYVGGECRGSSTAGEIYINAPGINHHVVTAISKSNPAVVTSVNHGLQVFVNTPVQLWGATGTGWSAVLGPGLHETWIDNDHFSIPVDSTGFGTLGGTITFGDNRCNGGDDPPSGAIDLCLANVSTYANAVGQYWMGPTEDINTRMARVISFTLQPYRQVYGASTAKPLPDGSWVLFMIGVGNAGQDVNMWMAKLPPFAPVDTVNRTNYQQVPVVIPAGPAGTTNAIIEFGYLEYGSATQYFCTSRAEKCVAGTSTTPFAFPADGSGHVETGLTGTSCSSGCTINLPLLSQRLAYYKVIMRDSGNATTFTGNPQIVVVP